jgi:hypothetical protein
MRDGSIDAKIERRHRPGSHNKPRISKRSIRMSSVPRFACPWAFRQARRSRGEPAAGVDGRPVEADTHVHNGRVVHVAHVPEPLVPQTDQREPRKLNELRRRRAKVLTEYRLSGLFSETDLYVIKAALNGNTLREIATPLGVTRQAVADRIQRLKNPAPFFWLAWQRMNRLKGRR